MQLTQANYLQHRDQIDWLRMPAALTDKPKIVTDSAAAKGWADMGEQTQKATEQFFKLCNMLIARDPTLLRSADSTSASSSQQSEQHADLPFPPSPPPSSKPKRTRTKSDKKPKATGGKLVTNLPASIPTPAVVPVIATHTAFIKRYVGMHGKIKTRDQIVSLLHGLQKAITEQRIKHGNPALREIQKMQSELIALAGKMEERAEIEIREPYLSHFQQIAEGEEVRTSVKLLKQFIQMNGKVPDRVKAEKLGRKMTEAYDTIPKEDLYRNDLAAGAKAVADYVNGSTKTVGIPEASLHGLSGLAGFDGIAGLGKVTGSNGLVATLREAKAKDLSDATLKRAFRKVTAPGLCLELAKLMMRRGELSIAVLKGQPVKKLTHRSRRNGTEGEHSNYMNGYGPVDVGVSPVDVLDMRLASAVQSAPVGGLGNPNEEVSRQALRSETRTVPVRATPPIADSVSARDLAKMRFRTIGYNGRFKDVVGDPAVGFHMMVYGPPFNGKSSFVIELCKDLAALGKGRIAYLALEEGISLSMQKKVIDRGADKVDGLEFKGAMPASFEGYGFIVIDSVSDRYMSRGALRDLFLKNSETCFICIFHATKAGSARGGLDYSHDMDIIIKIEDHKPVVEKNRFL